MGFLIVGIILMVIFAFVGSSMATTRNRDPMLWAILCALTGIVGVLILAAIGEERRYSASAGDPISSPPKMMPHIRQVSAPLQQPARYDVEKWRALVEIDPEIAAAFHEVAPYGAQYVDELAIKYLVLSDKNYLRPIVNKVLEMAQAEATRRAELAAQGRLKSTMLLDEYLETVQGNGGRDPDLQRAIKSALPYSGAAKAFEGEAIKVIFADGTAMLRGRSLKRVFRDEAEADAWGA